MAFESRVIDRFLSLTVPEPNSGCLLWLGSTPGKGYGRFKYGSMVDGTRVTRDAHKVSYEMFVGHVPRGLVVCHKCDTPSCVNHTHMFLDTIGGNNRDKQLKGRASKKVTADDVRDMRDRRCSGATLQSLADHYGITNAVVSKICLRKIWRHIP